MILVLHKRRADGTRKRLRLISPPRLWVEYLPAESAETLAAQL